MKKIILTLLLFLLAVSAYAADTCTTAALTASDISAGDYELLITCTADADASLQVTLTSADMAKMNRKWVKLISSYSNTVTAAGASGAELEIRDSVGRIIMDNNGHGNNFIVNGTTTYEYAEGPNDDHDWFVNSDYPWTIYIENITAAGTANILLTLSD
jgi:hypothetical protein